MCRAGCGCAVLLSNVISFEHGLALLTQDAGTSVMLQGAVRA